MDGVQDGAHPLARAIERIERHLERFGHRLTTSDGALDDLYVSVGEARRIMDGAPSGAGGSLKSAMPPAFEALGARFGLDPLEQELLLLAAAPGLDRDLARLYTFAWGDFTLKLPTAGFLAELAADDRAASARAVAALRPDGKLVQHRLLTLHVTDHWRPDPPLIHMGVTVPEAVLARLRGEAPLLHGAGRLEPAEPPGQRLWLDRGLAERIGAAWGEACESGRPVLVLSGAPGSGRRTALRHAAARRGMPLVVLDAARAPADGLAAVVGDLAREARASGGGLLVRADDLPDDAAAALHVGLERARRPGPLPVALAARRSSGALLRGLGDARVFELPPLPTLVQIELWQAALGDADDARARRLSDRFSMPPGAVIETAATVRRGGEVDEAACAALLRARIDHALDSVADPVETTLGWQDVVLPDEVRDSLEEIRAQARHRTRVFDEWGFRRKMAYGRGLACLFSGPPGTGKTMMAGIIANDLGRVLYRVDLSRIVSKWVGETEKNLARVFDEAERAQVILFFDEADSLFSKRTEVKGANDRFANMEVNYLLQRMEQYDGMSILTTNFERSIDDAFKRRLKFRVHFPMPDAEQRAELWQRMVPEQMAIADDIRWASLGKQFKFSGGSIKNAVLRAAFYAADGEGVLTHALLNKAADAERREMGRL